MNAIYDDNINLPLIQNTKKQSHTETLVHSMRTGFILLHSLVSIVLVSALVVAALATSTIAEWLPSIMWGTKKEDRHADGYRVLHFLVGIALVLLMCNVIAIYALCTAHKKIRVVYIILLCAVTLLLALHVTMNVMVARGALDLTATWEAMVQRCHTGNDTHRGENCACELEKYLKCSGWSQPCAESDNVSTAAAVDMMPLGEGTESWGLINPLLRFRRDMITNNNNKDEYRNVASRTPAPSCPLCSAEDQKTIDHYQRTCSTAVSEYYRESSREHATTYLFIAALLLAAMTTAAMIRPKQQVDLVINGRHLQFTSIQMEL